MEEQNTNDNANVNKTSFLCNNVNLLYIIYTPYMNSEVYKSNRCIICCNNVVKLLFLETQRSGIK